MDCLHIKQKPPLPRMSCSLKSEAIPDGASEVIGFRWSYRTDHSQHKPFGLAFLTGPKNGLNWSLTLWLPWSCHQRETQGSCIWGNPFGSPDTQPLHLAAMCQVYKWNSWCDLSHQCFMMLWHVIVSYRNQITSTARLEIRLKVFSVKIELQSTFFQSPFQILVLLSVSNQSAAKL